MVICLTNAAPAQTDEIGPGKSAVSMDHRCKESQLTIRKLVTLSRTACLLGLILIGMSIAVQCQTETVLHSFGGTVNDGFGPAGGLLVDASGNLFGTTAGGSTTLCDLGEVFGCGIVYELVKSSNGDTETILYSFGTTSPTGDGASPYAGLIADAAGNLYGTTTYGGSPNCLIDIGVDGCGTVFELVKTPTGYSESVLHTFTGLGDGANPYVSLTMDSSGNLYGTTYNGGACALGTVFELVKSSGGYTEKILYSFGCTPNDGSYPYGAVIADSAGNLYGTTESAGASEDGTVFELVNSGGEYTEKVLYNFSGTDGDMPVGGVIADLAGNLYGTTEGGGEYAAGTVFELTNSLGSYTENVLYSFKGPSDDDGQAPMASLVMDASGNLYGTARLGGTGCAPQGCGIVFELVNASGTYTEKIVHRFGAPGDGLDPSAPLVVDSAGNLYSVTGAGGAIVTCSCGTVFVINLTAIAPVATLSAISVTFGNQLVNMPSAPQSVTVTNTGSANLIFGSDAITISGANAADFSVNANTCTGATVAPEAACSVTITFSPSIVGSEIAALNFADNTSTTPQTVGLSGSGIMAPAVTISPTSLAFSSQPVGTMSASQTVSVTNRGGSQLNISSVTVSAGFTETNTCGPSLAVGVSCAINVAFAPTTLGLLNGTLSIVDNAPNSPQTATLTGTGTGPVANVSPSSVVFSNQIIGGTSEVETVSVSNTGNTDLTISSVAISGENAGDFAIVSSGTTCVSNSTIAPGSSCTVNMTFTPTACCWRGSTLAITDNSYNLRVSTQDVTLLGFGEDFGIAVASGTSPSATVTPGGTGTYSVSVSPEEGFNQAVTLACAGAPSEATCSVSPNSLLLNGNSSSAAMVTVTTTAASATRFLGWRNDDDQRSRTWLSWPAMWLMVGLLGLSPAIVKRLSRRHERLNRPQRWALLAAILTSGMMLVSCGAASSSLPRNPGTPPGSYTLTITGTSGALSHSTTLKLTVSENANVSGAEHSNTAVVVRPPL